MSSKITKQWFIDAVWGKIALISWGKQTNPPVILLHGYMDTAATFTLLVEQLPDTHYYVAVDLPGHGLSDPFPTSIVSQATYVEVIRIVADKLNWDKFILIAHSMSCLIGSFFQAVYSDRITKAINIDPALPMAHYFHSKLFPLFYQNIYGDYYEKLERYTNPKPRSYSNEEAINAVVRARNVTEEQASVLLSRALVPVGDGKFKLSWHPALRKTVNVPMTSEMLYHLMNVKCPSLYLCSTETPIHGPGKKGAIKILKELEKKPFKFRVFIKGGHDLQITNAEECALHITEFLDRDFFYSPNSKL